jgi:membrane protein implicated in regulation of membrane protease activity
MFYVAFPGYIIAFVLGGGIHGQTFKQLVTRATIVNFFFYAVVLIFLVWMWQKFVSRQNNSPEGGRG